MFNSNPSQLPVTSLPFIKMHGAGNDFVVLDAIAHPELLRSKFDSLAQTLCDRHLGIGGDGLLLLNRSENAPVSMRMWNPDGSEDMCGNGLRCIAHLAFERGTIGEHFTAQTLSGVHRGQRLEDGTFRLEMGTPSFEPSQIPLDTTHIEGSSKSFFLTLDGKKIGPLTSLTTGSTHTVLWSDESHATDFKQWSPQLEIHPAFPERSSILWAQVLAENLVGVRIWERGVGETLACGTGACAVAVAAMETNRVPNHETGLTIRGKGGDLRVWWNGKAMWLSGPAQIVFAGEFVAREALQVLAEQ